MRTRSRSASTRAGLDRASKSYGMRHRILEVEALAAADPRVFEVHPEVSFTELAGQPLASKRAASGAAERRVALARVGIEVPDLPYPLEDVLDAAVSAWSAARYARRGTTAPARTRGAHRSDLEVIAATRHSG
jgi:predicted RNase H-like nuclease